MAYFPHVHGAWNVASPVRLPNNACLVDVVQAYKSVAVFFDLSKVRFAEASQQLQQLAVAEPSPSSATEARRHQIPCCYELQLDLARVAEHLGLSTDEIIQLHSETEYTVYAIAFCPGFPYLG